LIRRALRQKHVRGILAQKPLAMDFPTAKALVEETAATDKVLSVNQNMRFDQSMRVVKQLLERNELGTPVLGTIEMRAIPHWQPFVAFYDRLTLLNMSIHHLLIRWRSKRRKSNRSASIQFSSTSRLRISIFRHPIRSRSQKQSASVRHSATSGCLPRLSILVSLY
jgi:predicted dehydrogenase